MHQGYSNNICQSATIETVVSSEDSSRVNHNFHNDEYAIIYPYERSVFSTYEVSNLDWQAIESGGWPISSKGRSRSNRGW